MRCLEVEQVRSSCSPLGPIDQRSSVTDGIRIETVDEGNVVCLNRYGRNVGTESTICIEKVGSMESAQYGSAVQIAGEVGISTWDLGSNNVQVSSTGECESNVSKDGSKAFELRSDIVQGSSSEWRSCRRVFRVKCNESSNIRSCIWVGGKVGCKVVNDLIGGSSV